MTKYTKKTWHFKSNECMRTPNKSIVISLSRGPSLTHESNLEIAILYDEIQAQLLFFSSTKTFLFE